MLSAGRQAALAGARGDPQRGPRTMEAERQMQMGALAPKGAAAETSPLLQYASAHAGSYDGASPGGWPGAAPGVGSPVPPELHRCRRAYGPRPLVVASIAIGAGSFAQGCAPGKPRAAVLRADLPQ